MDFGKLFVLLFWITLPQEICKKSVYFWSFGCLRLWKFSDINFCTSSAVLSSVVESKYDSRSKPSLDSESLSESSGSKHRHLFDGGSV